ncbi:hypothetical protein P3S68_005736 [Capsicum galapagoense]
MGVSRHVVDDMVFKFQYEEVVSGEGWEGLVSLAAALLLKLLLMEHPTVNSADHWSVFQHRKEQQFYSTPQ